MAPLLTNAERFLFEVEGIDPRLRVYQVEAREGLSELFSVDLLLACDDSEIGFDQVVGMPGVLELRGDNESRYFNGIVSGFELDSVGLRYSFYRALLVPKLWFLSQRHNSRIFQETSPQEIITTILSESGIPTDEFRFVLNTPTEPREYCVQYRESELNFVSRLLEEEGITYFFEHTYDKHVLIMASGAAAHQDITSEPTVLFHDHSAGNVPDAEHIFAFRYKEQVRPGAVTLRDFNFKKPAMLPEGEQRAEGYDALRFYDYPGGFSDPAAGKTRAQIRLEELRTPTKGGAGKSTSPRMTAGYRFKFDGYPRNDLNQKYLLTRTQHVASQPQVLEEDSGKAGTEYTCYFECISTKLAYRPPRITLKPVVEGAQTAIVVGPVGEEIYPDEYGRVKVQFHWDREGGMDEKSSCWIRVSQPWAGNQWGAVFIPRIGQEVIVNFLEGDPDRPIITGRVYHGTNKPPYPLPDEKTKTTLKSDSSPGGGGCNEVRFEDKKGEEQVFIHAEKNLDLRTKNDAIEWIGKDRHLFVKKDRIEQVENERHDKVNADYMQEIGADRHLNVKGKQALKTGRSHSLTVQGDMIEVFKSNHSEQTTQNYYLKAMGVVIESSTGITLKCGGSSIVIDPSGISVKGALVNIEGSMVKINSGPGSSPQSGTSGAAVTPAAPESPLEADVAEPGKAAKLREQQAVERAKLDFVPLSALDESDDSEEELTWIEIELVDEEDNPVPGERYEITTPDGRVKRGTLDENGFARVEGVRPGECKVAFPRLDKEAWKKA